MPQTFSGGWNLDASVVIGDEELYGVPIETWLTLSETEKEEKRKQWYEIQKKTYNIDSYSNSLEAKKGSGRDANK